MDVLPRFFEALPRPWTYCLVFYSRYVIHSFLLRELNILICLRPSATLGGGEYNKSIPTSPIPNPCKSSCCKIRAKSLIRYYYSMRKKQIPAMSRSRAVVANIWNTDGIRGFGFLLFEQIMGLTNHISNSHILLLEQMSWNDVKFSWI